MNPLLNRRVFGVALGTSALGSSTMLLGQDDKPAAPTGPVEAPFERDYEAPSF